MARQVNVHEAKTQLSKLLELTEQGEEITIARNGRPVARLVPAAAPDRSWVRGSLRGRVTVSPDFDAPDDEVERLFGAR